MGRFLLGAVLAVFTFSAQAATITFDFTNVVDNNNPVSEVDVAGSLAGYSVNVRANTSGNVSGEVLYQADQGLGVIAAPGDNNQVDGNGSNDRLIFLFNRPVRLEQIVFGNVQGNDEVRVNASLAGVDITPRPANNASPVANTLLFNSLEIDRAVVIARDNNDDFYVRSITVSEVPVPAAGVLFASALGLAGWARRRKAAA
jgi:hypothetical protein